MTLFDRPPGATQGRPETYETTCVGIVETAADLDEAGYLQANPDIRVSGQTAREHFESRGRTEGRLQAINRAEVARLRDRKFARLAFTRAPMAPRVPGEPIDFLPPDIVEEFAIPGIVPVSDHSYPAPVTRSIREHPEKLFLDIGAGLRKTYFANVVNTEIYPSVSTDVLCIGEALPFADAQFDYVLCFATLEHTRRPWDVAAEIARVLKPGGIAVTDYPFLQPVHGYPHHYFNATPMGHQSLFDRHFEICGVEVAWHHHPIVALQWSLAIFRDGLPPMSAHAFEQLRIADLLDRPVERLIGQPWSRDLRPDVRKIIASGSLVVAAKRGAPGLAADPSAVEQGKALAAAIRPEIPPPEPLGPFARLTVSIARVRRRARYLRHLPAGQVLPAIMDTVRRALGWKA